MTAAGVLLVDKPAGPTSFDVVARVKRALRARKAGHAGTLDPLATGLLVVCLEDAVKLQDLLTQGDKSYEAEVAFGAATDTEDAAGRVVERGDASRLDAAAVAAALPRFVGELEQRPPMYSAVRVGGRRLHHAARAGEQVERAARRVRVDAFELMAFEPAAPSTTSTPTGTSAPTSTAIPTRIATATPTSASISAAPSSSAPDVSLPLARASLAVRCSKGTYVRTLAADLGRALGVPAHLASLRRTGAGPFSVRDALPLADLERLARADPGAIRARLLPPARALSFLPEVRCTPAEARDLAHGRSLARAEALPPGLARATDDAGALVALCRYEGPLIRPVRVFASAANPSGIAPVGESPVAGVDAKG